MGLQGCSTRCGNMTVPYPFGINAGCYLPGFILTCDSNSRLLLGDGATGIQVTDFFLQNATLRVVTHAIIAEPMMSRPSINNTWGLGDVVAGPIILSYNQNRFIALGCGVHAKLTDEIEGNFIAECSSSCWGGDPGNWLQACQPGLGAEAECSGNGCCQSPIPQYAATFNARVSELDDKRNYAGILPTVILYIAEQGWIEGVWCRIMGWSANYFPIIPPDELLSTVPVMLEWAMNSTLVGYPGWSPEMDSRCPKDGVESDCKSDHSSCINMNSLYRSGYACRCSPGYDGNPYLIDGCQDINECTDPDHYPCYGECTNLLGTYQCRCPQGSQGNASVMHGCVEVPLLVYEFISNGTLYNHLHVEGPISRAWKDRLRIAVETARSLTYLHSFASIPIIHRDIKSPNILLDDNLVVKLSDFGASRYIPIDQEGIDTAVQGTLGYLDPMYNSTGHLTEKSDVYSFGVLLIELLTRKKPVSYRSSQGFVLVSHFVNLLSEGNLDEILDPQVTKEGDGEVIDIALLAAICVKLQGEERPTMRQVEMTLESIQAAKDFSSDMTDDDVSSERMEI
nr:unnamed protein product [Digitaria exilis]